MPLSSSFFKDWLAHLMWENEEKTPGNDSLRSAINVLRGKAILKGKQYFLYNRVAPDDNGLWLDLADKRIEQSRLLLRVGKLLIIHRFFLNAIIINCQFQHHLEKVMLGNY